MPIFSGDPSTDLWKAINKISKSRKKKKKKLARIIHAAMYLVGCKCQELESLVEKLRKELKNDS